MTTVGESDVAAGGLAPPPGPPFLTAEWRDVIGITFACPPEKLARYVPSGATIDTLEGAPRVSLVAFEFSHTRVRRIPVPGHIRFPEINLRFYVRFGGQRAVVFIRELVPRRAVAAIARLRYNEPYVRLPMSCGKEIDDNSVRVWHRFGQSSSLAVTASATATLPVPDSPAHWLTDHALGIGRRRNGQTVLYHVAHPTWALHEIDAIDLDVDFAAIYGPAWGWLADAEPSHVSLASGSAVTVSRPLPTRSAAAG
ncbi:MAG TPA: DUF2071 domain-containing protein [Baekduia sp.]|nr:DUF2071 domain-containing protein [Baekduia sp.]